MSIVAANEAETKVKPTRSEAEAAIRAIRDEAARRGLNATLHTRLVRLTESGKLVLPVTLEANGRNAYEEACALVDLEETWNEREPRPSLRLFVTSPASLIEMSTVATLDDLTVETTARVESSGQA